MKTDEIELKPINALLRSGLRSGSNLLSALGVIHLYFNFFELDFRVI